MRITTKAVFDIKTGKLLHWEGYEYNGPVALAGGGPDRTQQAAEQANANLAGQAGRLASEKAARQTQLEGQVLPFYGTRMKSGLPYFNAATDYSGALNARAYNPAKADLIRRLGSQTGLPSGYADQAISDFEANRARGFDNNLLDLMAQNEAEKQYGASGIASLAEAQNPQSYFGTAGQLNQSVLNAPRKPGIAGIIGGVVGSAAKAFA